MSDVIKLLPDSVANQIAAGEVIQRPSSVIKELVENALDAEATVIHVVVKEAGRTLIQVIDNGKGMSTTDARLSFERHATSKIRKAKDLFALQTMGFRGEALASIAAIAQVELRTRRAEDELGTLLTLAGSVVESQEPITTPQGSNFAVKNIFYNVPARRKFLKNNQTEFSNILSEVERIALVNTQVAFTVRHNDNEVLNLPVGGFKQRIIRLFGKIFNQQLLKVEVDTSLIQIDGYIGKPENARKRNALQYLFVNGRYMRHPYFHKAIMTCYEPLLAAGEMPNYFLKFTVDPAAIDVNIHPTKTEIKFENEQHIWQIIAAAVKEALGKFSAVPSIDFDMMDAPDIPVFDTHQNIQPPQPHYNPSYNPFNKGGGSAGERPTMDWNKLYEGFNNSTEMPEGEGGESHTFLGSKANNSAATGIFHSKVNTPEASDFPPVDSFAPLETTLSEEQPTLISSKLNSGIATSGEHLLYKGQYILTTVKSGLILIDQHRAHIRILFDRYLAQIKGRKGASQRLLFPEMVQLTPSQAAILPSIEEDLSFLGFDISPLGNSDYAINATPAGVEGMNVTQLVHDMVASALEGGDDVKANLQERIALTLAKAAAIPYGQLLTQLEMEQLIDDLFACSLPNYTPDGKPTLSLMSDDEITKRFK